MNDADRYAKIVRWSDEDGCFVGQVPDLFYGGCHGDDERAVYEELCEIVDEVIELHRQDGRPLPPPCPGADYPQSIAENMAGS